MKNCALLFCFFLLLSLANFSHSDTDHQDYDNNEALLNRLSLVDFEFHSSSPLGFFIRLGDDFTFRRYGDYLSLNGLRTLPSMAFSAMMYWMVSKTTASVLSRWTVNPVTLHTAQVLSMAILPGVKSALYSWYTGTRPGSEQIQADAPHIRRRFYLELIYQQESHQQILRITPFPLNPSINPRLAETPFSDGYSHWLQLYEASLQHSVVYMDLSWVSPETPEAIRIDIHYSDKATESTLVTLTRNEGSESLPVSIESLLHNEAKHFAQGHAIASLLSDAVIKNTVALIQNPDSSLTSLPVTQVAGQLEFDDADGHSGQLSLCGKQQGGEQQADCNSHLQLTYKLFPYPHFGMILQGQYDIKNSVDATVKQLANANRAELMLQLLEKAVLHFFITSVQQNNQEAKKTGNDYVPPSLQQTPSHPKLVAPLQLLVKTLMPEGSLWKSGKRHKVAPIPWRLYPGSFRHFMVEPEASSSNPLNSLTARPALNTAIFTEKQVELIKKLADGDPRSLPKDEFINAIDFLERDRHVIGKSFAQFESPTLWKELVKNRLLHIYEVPKEKITKDVILAKPNFVHSKPSYEGMPDELKKDVDFLFEYSKMAGIPRGTPPELAIFIYGHLDTTAKINSLRSLPNSFKNDELYDELIHSGMIELEDLPKHIKIKNKDYCLSQLLNGFCKLSEVPVHFLTKEIILNSISGKHWDINASIAFFSEYNRFTKDPDFLEAVMVKALTVEQETEKGFKYTPGNLFDCIYFAAINRYKADKKTLNSLLIKLIKTNPFMLIPIKNYNNELPQEFIDTAKDSLRNLLKTRPEVSQHFYINFLYAFFSIVSADDDFKTDVLNIVYPYLPEQNYDELPEEILLEQDKIVLKSEVPFDRGKMHLLSRKLKPDNPHIAIDYMERHIDFFRFFDDKDYLEKCCIDPIIRQRLIRVLAERLIADKQSLLVYWKDLLPPKLLDAILDFLKDPALFFKLDSANQLSEPVHPLQFQSPNTEAFPLVVVVHAVGFHASDEDAGHQLKLAFAHAGKTHFQRVYSAQHPLSLFTKKGTILGGRTLKIPNGEWVDYYKFQRIGESVDTLAQEGIMHQLIAKNDRFKSQKPLFGQYLVVLEKDLPEITRHFTDRLQVNSVESERILLVYYFQATDDYSQYAYTPDKTNTPYASAERGLLNGIHDIGVLNGQYGVMPTSAIPAFHFTGRRWVFLSPLLGNSKYFAFPLPGKFENWIEAIERPDFGWSGLRDWGDVEFYGSMKSGFGSEDSKTWGYTPEVFQRLSFANALCENMLAAVLLRSRLRRDSPDYHYQNPQAVEETKTFIEQLLNEYLSGLFAEEKEQQPTSRLQSFMKFDDTQYRAWLTRSAQEILYWTALQPYEATEHCTFTPNSECYSEHLKDTGRLDKTLYPKPLHYLEEQKKFPRDFTRNGNHLHLGATNAMFPLVTLTKLITRFVSHVFVHRNLERDRWSNAQKRQ
ncbi:hypothetical protein [Endozoicomonas sp. 4G]|uniref:hypothetical protein n=1 Tax=Endozoicomonas sp. 4G TaxID=2872754 RepID=UPI0020786B81|nr:hypothetical protein [Endozoicomonas sp. 4G]